MVNSSSKIEMIMIHMISIMFIIIWLTPVVRLNCTWYLLYQQIRRYEEFTWLNVWSNWIYIYIYILFGGTWYRPWTTMWLSSLWEHIANIWQQNLPSPHLKSSNKVCYQPMTTREPIASGSLLVLPWMADHLSLNMVCLWIWISHYTVRGGGLIHLRKEWYALARLRTTELDFVDILHVTRYNKIEEV